MRPLPRPGHRLGHRTALVLTGCLVAVGLGGCSGNATPDPSSAAAPTVTVTVTATPSPGSAPESGDADPEAAVQLDIGSSGTSCFSETYPDLAWMDSQWTSHAEVSWVRFRLQGSGVRAVGAPVSVPPVNPGGAIISGAEVAWPPGAALRDSVGLSWSQRESTRFLSMFDGQTGALLFHLQFSPAVLAGKDAAHVSGIETTWTLDDGTRGSTTTPVDLTWSYDLRDCR